MASSKRVAVFDVGSGSVAAAIIEVRKGKPTQVLAAHRAILSQEERVEAQRIAGLTTKCQEAGEKTLQLLTESGVNPSVISEALIVIHTPWAQSSTFETKRVLETEMKVVPQMIAELAQQAAGQETQLVGEIFEKSVIRVAINGYPTASPEGKRASELGVTVFQSADRNGIVGPISSVIGALLPGRDIKVRSSTFMTAVVLRTYAPRAVQYCITDVTSEATSFTTIYDGVLQQQGMVPVGTRTILRLVAERQGAEVSPDHILSLVRMRANGACSSAMCEQVDAVLGQEEPALVKQFGEVLAVFAQQQKIPNTLILTVHPDMAQWFTGFLTRVDFSQFTATTRPFSVRELLPKHLANQVLFRPGVMVDSGIAVAGAFVNTPAA